MAQCSFCVKRPGETLPDHPVKRDLEVLAYHMLSAKNWVQPVATALSRCARFSLTKRPDGFEHYLACD